MKIPREYTINYIVHAISILDLDLLSQILKPLADSVADKIEVAQYIYDYFHQKENINSFFLQILHEIKFVRGLFFPSASNRKTHLIVI